MVNDVTIAIMGATGTGKTTFVNLVSGSNLKVGGGLESCTSAVQVSKPFDLDGRSVTLIDTPGFDDSTMSDTDILKMVSTYLATAYKNGKKLAGVIYVHRISDIRMGGTSARNFKMFKKLCGESSLKNVVILTNMWGEVSRQVGESREAQLASQDMFFKPALDNGAQLLRHENTLESGHKVLRNIIRNHPVVLCIQREIVDEGKDVSQTTAGAELSRELKEQVAKHQEEMRILQEETQRALREREEAARRALEAERRRAAAERARAEKQAADFRAEQDRLRREVERAAEAARQEAARAAAEHERQMREMHHHHNDGGCRIF